MQGLYEKLNLIFVLAMIMLLACGSLIPSYAGENDGNRANVEEKYKWNLKDLYPSLDGWKNEKEKIGARFSEISKYKGTLGQSASQLKEALETYYEINKEFVKVYVYASMLSDQDTRESDPMAMKQEVRQLIYRTIQDFFLYRS